MNTTRTINREILRLSLPSILANITIPLVGMVDTAIVGHIANAVAIGGIAIGTMLFDLLYWNFGFLRVGTGGMTAQAYGRKDQTTQIKILTQSLTIALAATLLIWTIQYLFVQIVLALVPCTPQVAQFAKTYFYIRIWAAPATLALMAFKGWFIGMQNSIAPMLCDIIVNTINIIASILLSFYTPIGIMGVAYGTLIAQYAGLITAILLLTKYKHLFHHINIKKSIQWNEIKQLFALNTDLFIRSLCFMVIYIGFTSLTAKYGDNLLAVSSIIMKIMMLFSYFIDGFAYAGEAMTGRFIGENNHSPLRLTIRLLFIWTIAIGILFTILFALYSNNIFSWMTTDHPVIQSAQPFFPWLIAMPLLSVFAFMWDGIYVGATAGKEVRNCMFYSAIGFLAGYIALEWWIGIHAVYVGYFVHLIVRDLYLSFKWKSVENRVFMQE